MTSYNAKNIKFRLYGIIIIFFLVFIGIICQALRLQVINANDLAAKAKAEGEKNVRIGSVRGEIYDRNAEKLASSITVESAFSDNKNLIDRGETALILSENLGLNFETLVDKLSTDSRFVWLKRQLNEDEQHTLKELALPGIHTLKEYKRNYPNGTLAAHLLGFVGVDGQGLEGVELALDDFLKAGTQKVKLKRDGQQRTRLDDPNQQLNQSNGASVYLTIDRRVQYIAEKALYKAAEEKNAKKGMVLVSRPKTGEILAAAIYPPFDPNDYKSGNASARRNIILTDPFEPGSTFKIFVVAAALEEKLVTPDTLIDCEMGAYKVANHTVRDTAKYGLIPVSQVIKRSSNIGSLKIGDLLGPELLHNYLVRFSFGDRTGLEFPHGESRGLLRAPEQWHKLDAANIAFGQGISVTALQLIMAIGALANDGVLMKPYLVDKIVDAEGQVIKQYEPQIIRQVVSPLTARQVGAMMRMAVMKGGTGTKAETPGYPVAGKTGTAQKVADGGKTYAVGKYVTSFLGFAPYHDPEICVIVVLDEPWPFYYGADAAAPVFREVVEAALPILDVTPTDLGGEPIWPTLVKKADGAPGVLEQGQPSNIIRVKLKNKPLGKIEGLKEEKVELTSVGLNSNLNKNNVDYSVPMKLEPGIMPNLTGLSLREAMDFTAPLEMEFEYHGSGVVMSQVPAAGSAVNAGDAGKIFLERF